ncbi:MAG: DUF3391 domain-containing protein [Granulosicoccus sp.]
MRRKATAVKSIPRPLENVTTRIVNDRRWIHRNQLEIGMYINELDRPWSETRFMFQGFTIDTPAMLLAVQESCEYAQVESEKLAYISSNSPARISGAWRNKR